MIMAQNAGLKLPHEPIIVAVRADKSDFSPGGQRTY